MAMPSALLWVCAIAAVLAVDDFEPLVDPESGMPITSRPTAFGKYLNSKFLNVAASHNGGSIQAAFSQDWFLANQAIDGITTGEHGWAYWGRLDKAIALFRFKQGYRVSRIRLLSGVSRFSDHHVTAFQVWYSNETAAMLPPSIHWFPHYHWHPVIDMQPVTLDAVVIGNRVFTDGQEEVVLKFSPVHACAVLLKIDAADSPASNAVITEFEVFTADPSEVSAPVPKKLVEYVDHSWTSPPPRGITWRGVETTEALPGGQTLLLLPAPDTDVVPFRFWSDRTSPGGNKTRASLPLTISQATKDLGMDVGGIMRMLCAGRWFSPFHPRVSYMQPHMLNSKASTYCESGCGPSVLAIDGSGVHVSNETTCKALAGSEFLFMGDTRTRHMFLATIAYLRGVNLRGFLNPSFSQFYGQANTDFWFPPGRAESCGASMPHGFELECAGVVAGQVVLCNGTVTLRLEEIDDRDRLLKRLGHWMDVRKACEGSESCASKHLFVVYSLPIPKIRQFSTMTPVHPTVPLVNMSEYIQGVFDVMNPVWNASVQRHAWYMQGGAAALRTSLIWSTTEPFALNQPRHAVHNRNITQLNAEARQLLDIAGIPVLDGFKLSVERHDCHPDNVHYCTAVTNAKVGVLIIFARQLVEKMNQEEATHRSALEVDAVRRKFQERAEEQLHALEEESAKAVEEEKVKRKAVEEARAKQKQVEQEAKRAKQEKVKEKFAKFDKARSAKASAGKAEAAGGGGEKDQRAAEHEGKCSAAGESCRGDEQGGGKCSATGPGQGMCSSGVSAQGAVQKEGGGEGVDDRVVGADGSSETRETAAQQVTENAAAAGKAPGTPKEKQADEDEGEWLV